MTKATLITLDRSGERMHEVSGDRGEIMRFAREIAKVGKKFKQKVFVHFETESDPCRIVA
jgi:hypothetical protein